jgi:hypothetical protein
MDTTTFSNPAFQVVREAAGLRIRVPVKSDRFRSLLNLVWLLVWASVEGAIILYLLRGFDPSGAAPFVPFPLAGMFLGVFTIAGGVVGWRWLWGLGGEESFLVERNALLARREIWGIGHTRRFELQELRSLKSARLQYRVNYPSWGRMFIGHGDGEIVVDYAGRTYAYGKGLEEAEAWDLVDLLEDEIAFRFEKPRLFKARTAFLR